MYVRSVGVSFCALMFLFQPSVSFGATASIKAKKINGAPIAPSAHVIAAPGDRIEVELRLWGWNADQLGSRLRTYQLGIDGRHGYVSGTSGILLPAGWDAPPDVVDCASDADCPPWAPDCTANPPLYPIRPCLDVCSNGCPAQYPVCGPPGSDILCLGPAHTQTNLEQFAFVDTLRPDHVHFGLGPIAAVSVVGSVDYKWGSASFPDTGPLDPGPPGLYAGTLTIDVPSDASGTFTTGLDPVPDNTFGLLSPGLFNVIPITAEPLIIEVRVGPTIIPTVSAWGMVVLALSLLTLVKLYSSRSTKTS